MSTKKTKGSDSNNVEVNLGEIETILSLNKTVFIRTVTHAFVGTVRRITETHEGVPTTVVLQPAAWVSDTGRLGEFLAKGKASATEAEPYPGPVMVPFAVIIDVSPWDHEVPREPV